MRMELKSGTLRGSQAPRYMNPGAHTLHRGHTHTCTQTGVHRGAHTCTCVHTGILHRHMCTCSHTHLHADTPAHVCTWVLQRHKCTHIHTVSRQCEHWKPHTAAQRHTCAHGATLTLRKHTHTRTSTSCVRTAGACMVTHVCAQTHGERKGGRTGPPGGQLPGASDPCPGRALLGRLTHGSVGVGWAPPPASAEPGAAVPGHPNPARAAWVCDGERGRAPRPGPADPERAPGGPAERLPVQRR